MATTVFLLAVAVLLVVAAAGPRYAKGSDGPAPWRHPTPDDAPAASLRGDMRTVLDLVHRH